MKNTCPKCGSTYKVNSKYCHVCGNKRNSYNYMKIIGIIFLVIAFALSTSSIMFVHSCINEFSVDRKEKAKTEKEGKEYAIKYIKEKYGFDINVKSTYAEINDEGSWVEKHELTNFVYNTVEYNNKQFKVLVDLNNLSETRDTYQQEEIFEAIKNKINAVTGINAINILIFNNFELNQDFYAVDYFDGSNLESIIESEKDRGLFDHSSYLSYECHYINADLSNVNLEEYDFAADIIYLINFKDKDSYNQTRNWIYDKNIDFYQNAINLKEVYTLIDNKPKYINFNLQEYDGFYYYDPTGKTHTINKLNETVYWDSSDIEKIVTDSYSIDIDEDDTVYIFYPINKLIT